MDNAEYERRLLLDYLWFGRMVLALQARALNEAHEREADHDRRRAYLVSIHTILIQECEHVAAWLLAFRRWAENRTPLIETLLRYGPGEAYLEARLEGITDGHALLRISGIEVARLVPTHVPQDVFETRAADIWEGLRHYAGQQSERSDLYNKSKHGMVFVSSAAALSPEAQNIGPVALYAEDRRATVLRVHYVGLRDDPDQPGVMAHQTLGLANVLGDIITFYLLQEHPTMAPQIDAILHTRGAMLMLPDSGRA